MAISPYHNMTMSRWLGLNLLPPSPRQMSLRFQLGRTFRFFSSSVKTWFFFLIFNIISIRLLSQTHSIHRAKWDQPILPTNLSVSLFTNIKKKPLWQKKIYTLHMPMDKYLHFKLYYYARLHVCFQINYFFFSQFFFYFAILKVVENAVRV